LVRLFGTLYGRRVSDKLRFHGGAMKEIGNVAKTGNGTLD
jgi:hypothetical protein